MALTPPGGKEQSTMKSGCFGSALMRVIWLAICGSSPPKVSSPSSASAPANSAQRRLKKSAQVASNAMVVSIST